MARISGVDLPPRKRIDVGLTYIFGIGSTRSKALLAKARVEGSKKVKELSDDEALRIQRVINQEGRVEGAEDFETLFGAKFDLVSRYVHVESTRRNLARLRDEARELFLGKPLPRVFYHADLRGKHVQVHPDGHVLAYVDWGSGEPSDLPYFDLMHLVIHERKQDEDLTVRRAWEILRDRDELRDYERAATDAYAERVGLDAEVCRGLERLYPVLVGAMAEANWDYSRPRWIHRQFGL